MQVTDVVECNDKNNPVNGLNIDIQQASSMNNGLPKSPNGNASAINCNGMLPVSPSNKEARLSSSQEKAGDEKFKLLTQEDSSNDLNIDARESDALLKK